MSRATTRHVRHAKPTAHVTPCRAAPGAPQIHVGPRTAMPPMPSPGPRPLPARHAPCPARSTPLHHVVPGHDHGPAPRAQALPVHRPDVARASGQLHALTTGRKKARTCRAGSGQKKRPRRALFVVDYESLVTDRHTLATYSLNSDMRMHSEIKLDSGMPTLPAAHVMAVGRATACAGVSIILLANFVSIAL